MFSHKKEYNEFPFIYPNTNTKNNWLDTHIKFSRFASIRRYFLSWRVNELFYPMCVNGADDRFYHDDVIQWKHFPRYWPFVRGIHRSPVNSPHKGQWRGALMFSLICARINGWVNNGEASDLRRHRAHYDVIVMYAILFRKQAGNDMIVSLVAG